MAEGTSPGKEDLGPRPAGGIMECGYLGEPGRRPAIEQAPAARRGEDRFFATVFLGSGLLFVGMLFVAAAVAGGLIAASSRPAGPPGADTLTLGRNVTSVLLNVYATRMAAVFTLTTVTIASRTHIVARWLEVAGLVTALVLLVGVGIPAWVQLLFPDLDPGTEH